MTLTVAGNAMRKILLVEDEKILLLSETTMLKKHGFEVVAADSGASCFAQLQRNSDISLVLMDINLGQEELGTEVAARVLEQYAIPIVFLTNHAESEYVQRARTVTNYGYVLKNSGEFVLIESIHMAFELFEAHKETKRQESRYRLLADNSTEIVTVLDLDLNPRYVSPSARKLLGYTREERLSVSLSQVLSPASYQRAKELVESRSPGDLAPKRNEFDLVHKAGHLLRCEILSRPFLDENGEKSGTILSIRDISEQERVKEALKQSEMRNRAILDAFPDLLFIHDRDGTYLDYHAARREDLYRDPEELLGKRVQDVLPEGVGDRIHRLIAEVLHSQNLQTGEIELIIAGVQKHFELRLVPYEEEKTLSVVRDITDRKLAEKGMQQALKEKSRLMQELNHRVKNNLALIASLVRLKDLSLEGDADLSDIEHQIEAIRIIHEKLFETSSVSSIEMSEYAQEILTGVFSLAPMPVRIEKRMEKITVDTKTAVTLGLIMNEIAVNAVKYGFIENEAASFLIELQKVTPKRGFSLRMTNSGRPFPEEVDFNGNGTLGLSLLHNLVEQLKGRVELQKTPSAGYFMVFPKEELR